MIVVDHLLGGLARLGEELVHAGFVGGGVLAPVVEFLPGAFVESDAGEECEGCAFGYTSGFSRCVGQSVGCFPKVFEALVDHVAAVIARTVELARVEVEGAGEQDNIAVVLHEFEVTHCAEELGFCHRNLYSFLVAESFGVLEQKVGVEDALVVFVICSVGGRYYVDALAEVVDAGASEQIGAIVAVGIVADAAAQVGNPAVELVGVEAEIVGGVPDHIVAHLSFRLEVKAGSG